MSAAQRVSRGFHRLGMFLAAIPLLIGGGISIFDALNQANAGKQAYYEQLALNCAQELAKAPQTRPVKDGEVIPLPPGKNPWEIAWRNPPPVGMRVIAYPDSKDASDQFDEKYDLKEMGCSEQARKVSWQQIMEALPLATTERV
jgi:hypothetical protein